MSATGKTFLRCASCDKANFGSRRNAKHFLARNRKKGLHPYRCPVEGSTHWHIGHLPRDVRFGAAARNDYQPLVYGSSHLAGRHTIHRMVTELVRNELSYPPRLQEVAARVTAHIALIQRTEDRSPTLRECAAGLPQEYQEMMYEPDEDWRSSHELWRDSVNQATMIELARRTIILFSSDGSEVRIGNVDQLYAAAA